MTVKVQDLYNAMDDMAPFSLTMDFDNTGLLVGDRDAEVTGVVMALDCTMGVLEEAEKQGANVVITHHPIIFRGIKSVTADSIVYHAIRKGINVISAHTNLDIAQGGVNDCLADRLKLSDLTGLTVTQDTPFHKITVFVPHSHSEKVYEAMTAAGAGTLAPYSGCAYFIDGTGTFLPEEGAHPFLGTPGQREITPEVRIEMVCPVGKTGAVVKAMKEAHPYEVPAYDIMEDKGLSETQWLGRIGTLEKACEPEELAAHVKKCLGGVVRYTKGKSPVQKVAICGGAGDSELGTALRSGADALITGEVKHHIFLEAVQAGITLIEAGHFHTEVVVLEPVMERLKKQFPELDFTLSQIEPVCTL